jgi:hypothetical protein
LKQTDENSALSDRDLQLMQMGRATVIPGFQKAIDVLERRHTPSAAAAVAELRRLEPAKPTVERRSKGSKSYWAKMTPEERTIEMRRRRGVADAKKVAKLHPSNKNHPDHDKWRKKLGDTRRKEWAALSPRQRKQRVKKLRDGKAAKAQATTPTVILGRTA